MKQIKLAFVELHSPLFLAGKNFSTKIATEKTNVTLIYDRDEKELHVVYMGKAAIIPFTSVHSMEPVNAKDADIDMTPANAIGIEHPVAVGKIKAQVSAPKGIKI